MAHFENEVLKLSEIMIPPLMSSTMTGKDILGGGGNNPQQPGNKVAKQVQQAAGETNKGGRPEKADSQKSDKTIANRESAGKE